MRMNLEARRLRILIALADEGSFTDAAIALGVSQAAVSRGLASLEADLGVRLVHRTTRELTFTAAGSAALVHARRVLDDVAALERAVGGGTAELRLGYAWAALGERTAVVQEAWQVEHPDVALVWTPVNSRTAGLLEGITDMAVLRHSVDDRRLRSSVVGLEPRVAAVASGHPLARKRTLRLGDFDGGTIAIDPVTGSTTEALWPEGSGPASTLQVRGIEEWLAAVATGRAMGISSGATAWHHPRPGVAFRRMTGVPPVAVSLAWRASDAPPLAQSLVSLAASAYDSPA